MKVGSSPRGLGRVGEGEGGWYMVVVVGVPLVYLPEGAMLPPICSKTPTPPHVRHQVW